jgi:type IV pilus assembly protein PilW
VKGADVLTIRYLKPGAGWAIVPSGGSGTTLDATNGVVTQIDLVQRSGEPALNTFSGSLAMLADCSNAQVFTVSGAGSATLIPNNNYASAPSDISPKGTPNQSPRVFDFNNDFQTVTYFLQAVCADGSSPCTHTTGELVRRVNGQNSPLVTGVERLDFRYGIIDASGNTEFLTADQVDAATDASGASIPCPPDVATPGGMPATGCLWRAVQTIEVHILMDGQTPLYTLTPDEMKYIYTPDSASATPIAPTAHAIQPNADQGFPSPLLRREFTTLVALRNFNP